MYVFNILDAEAVNLAAHCINVSVLTVESMLPQYKVQFSFFRCREVE